MELYNPDALDNTVSYGLSVHDEVDTVMEKIKEAIDGNTLCGCWMRVKFC